MENDGIRLTLIPMTQDNATFGYFLEYTDGRPGTLKLSNGLTLQPSAYDYYSKIQLQTDTGELYDLIHYGSDGINLLTTDREVRGIGTKILGEELFL